MDHLDQVKELWNYCFDDGPEFTNWFFLNRYSHTNTLAVYNNQNKIESALQLLPYNIYLHGKVHPISYIVGVSTWPEYRGRGHARNLLHKALDSLREKGEFISILLPFNYNFYRRYGWEICYDYIEYNIELDNILLDMDRQLVGHIRKVRLEDDLQLLDLCYTQFMSNYNGYIVRSKADWKRVFDDLRIYGGDGYILQYGDDVGYILFTYGDDKINIRELQYTHTSIKYALLCFVSMYRKESDIKWMAPLDDITYLDMLDSRNTMHRQPYVMGRIVDIQKALASISLPTTQDIKFKMKVDDKFYTYNDGTYLIENKSGTLKITPIYDKNPHIKLDINTLTQLFWGYLTVDIAVREGNIIYSDTRFVDMLKAVFTESTTMIYEDY